MVCELFHFYARLVFVEKGKQTANITYQHETAYVSAVIRNVCFNGWPNHSAVSYYFTWNFSEEKPSYEGNRPIRHKHAQCPSPNSVDGH